MAIVTLPTGEIIDTGFGKSVGVGDTTVTPTPRGTVIKTRDSGGGSSRTTTIKRTAKVAVGSGGEVDDKKQIISESTTTPGQSFLTKPDGTKLIDVSPGFASKFETQRAEIGSVLETQRQQEVSRQTTPTKEQIRGGMVGAGLPPLFTLPEGVSVTKPVSTSQLDRKPFDVITELSGREKRKTSLIEREPTPQDISKQLDIQSEFINKQFGKFTGLSKTPDLTRNKTLNTIKAGLDAQSKINFGSSPAFKAGSIAIGSVQESSKEARTKPLTFATKVAAGAVLTKATPILLGKLSKKVATGINIAVPTAFTGVAAFDVARQPPGMRQKRLEQILGQDVIPFVIGASGVVLAEKGLLSFRTLQTDRKLKAFIARQEKFSFKSDQIGIPTEKGIQLQLLSGLTKPPSVSRQIPLEFSKGSAKGEGISEYLGVFTELPRQAPKIETIGGTLGEQTQLVSEVTGTSFFKTRGGGFSETISVGEALKPAEVPKVSRVPRLFRSKKGQLVLEPLELKYKYDSVFDTGTPSILEVPKPKTDVVSSTEVVGDTRFRFIPGSIQKVGLKQTVKLNQVSRLNFKSVFKFDSVSGLKSVPGLVSVPAVKTVPVTKTKTTPVTIPKFRSASVTSPPTPIPSFFGGGLPVVPVPPIIVPPSVKPPFVVPPLFPGGGGRGRRGGASKLPKPKTKFTPSLVGLEFGIKGKKPKFLAGIGVRPIISKVL